MYYLQTIEPFSSKHFTLHLFLITEIWFNALFPVTIQTSECTDFMQNSHIKVLSKQVLS